MLYYDLNMQDLVHQLPKEQANIIHPANTPNDIQYSNLDDSTKSVFLKIFDDVIKTIFMYDTKIYGGYVRDYLIRKEIPKDIDVSCANIEYFTNKLKNMLKFSFDIIDDKMPGVGYGCRKLTLIHKHIALPTISMDICTNNIIGSRLDLDVNGLVISKDGSIKFTGDNNLSMFPTVYSNIINKQFTLLRKYTRPAEPRRVFSDLKLHSLLLIEYFRIFSRCMKMLNRGWTIKQSDVNEKLIETFQPFIFKLSKDLIDTPECTICCNNFDMYYVETQCCHQSICVECSLKYVVAHMNKTYIKCPYCIVGDVFGWGTIESSKHNENYPLVSNMDTKTLFK